MENGFKSVYDIVKNIAILASSKHGTFTWSYRSSVCRLDRPVAKINTKCAHSHPPKGEIAVEIAVNLRCERDFIELFLPV